LGHTLLFLWATVSQKLYDTFFCILTILHFSIYLK
jgi:hypothetical protein